MNTRKFLLTGITLSVLVGLTACGGASDSTTVPTKGTTTTTTGPITAFGRSTGNTIVNGIEFNTANANIVVEGKANATKADLKVGMMVTIKASNTTASSISSKDEVEGVVTDPIPGGAITGDLTVMGQTVTIDDKTIFESYVDTITDAGMITQGNVIEVSGYSTGTGTITATRLEVKALAWDASMELEVSGTVAKNDAAAKTFEIGNLVVLYTNAMLKDIPNDTIADGMHVEVKSTEGLNADNQLVASKVELESNDSATEGD
ncbi:MAG: DUF5666 domain-containing protein, partial [Thiohalomonadales bacterium]